MKNQYPTEYLPYVSPIRMELEIHFLIEKRNESEWIVRHGKKRMFDISEFSHYYLLTIPTIMTEQIFRLDCTQLPFIVSTESGPMATICLSFLGNLNVFWRSEKTASVGHLFWGHPYHVKQINGLSYKVRIKSDRISIVKTSKLYVREVMLDIFTLGCIFAWTKYVDNYSVPACDG